MLLRHSLAFCTARQRAPASSSAGLAGLTAADLAAAASCWFCLALPPTLLPLLRLLPWGLPPAHSLGSPLCPAWFDYNLATWLFRPEFKGSIRNPSHLLGQFIPPKLVIHHCLHPHSIYLLWHLQCST